MKKYFCDCCNYDAKVKSSFDKHLRTKKHQENKMRVNQKSTKVNI